MASETEICSPTFSHVYGLSVNPRTTNISVSIQGIIRLNAQYLQIVQTIPDDEYSLFPVHFRNQMRYASSCYIILITKNVSPIPLVRCRLLVLSPYTTHHIVSGHLYNVQIFAFVSTLICMSHCTRCIPNFTNEMMYTSLPIPTAKGTCLTYLNHRG